MFKRIILLLKLFSKNNFFPLLRSALLTLLIVSSFLYSSAQQSRISFDAYSGAGAGWWVFNKVLVDSNNNASIAHDRTHLALMIPYGADFLLEINRIRIGAGFTFRQLQDNVMVGSEHSPINYDIYPVAAYNIEILQYHLSLEYELHSQNKFEFSPQLKIGSFQLNADHPNENEFKNKFFVEAGANFLKALSPIISIFARPHYLYMIINSNSIEGIRQRHNIYGLGAQLGFRISLNEVDE